MLHLGKIAPNVTGSFSIVIDPKKTNVSIKYSIQLDKSKLINEKINIISIEEIQNNNQLIKTDEATYTGIIPLGEINSGKVNKIKVKISWENDEENNKIDTTLGTLNNYTLSIPINVVITQYLGEKIEEYTSENTQIQQFDNNSNLL